ncbi:MAG: YwiC-like family protein [Anaerolineae bacterium]|nr:YwiC-like family protein [Anaerolineae bacterium]
MTETTAAPRVRLRPIALPTEHGGWGFLLEPVLLGLLVAPSPGGIALALAALGMFLARHPLRLALTDRRRGRRFARTGVAERFVLLYGALAAVSLAVAALIARPGVLVPLLAAAPLLTVHIIYDAQGNSRHWLPEMLGPTALAANAACIALAGGWTLDAALALWPILVARAVPSVLYVRARLRLERGTAPSVVLPLASHALGLAALVLLAAARVIPWLAVLALIILLARATYGLSEYRQRVPAKTVGFQEIGYGLLTVLLTAAGYATGI